MPTWTQVELNHHFVWVSVNYRGNIVVTDDIAGDIRQELVVDTKTQQVEVV
jgi:hypothetical protein